MCESEDDKHPNMLVFNEGIALSLKALKCSSSCSCPARFQELPIFKFGCVVLLPLLLYSSHSIIDIDILSRTHSTNQTNSHQFAPIYQKCCSLSNEILAAAAAAVAAARFVWNIFEFYAAEHKNYNSDELTLQ